jgi:hypothetical protein
MFLIAEAKRHESVGRIYESKVILEVIEDNQINYDLLKYLPNNVLLDGTKEFVYSTVLTPPHSQLMLEAVDRLRPFLLEIASLNIKSLNHLENILRKSVNENKSILVRS